MSGKEKRDEEQKREKERAKRHTLINKVFFSPHHFGLFFVVLINFV